MHLCSLIRTFVVKIQDSFGTSTSNTLSFKPFAILTKQADLRLTCEGFLEIMLIYAIVNTGVVPLVYLVLSTKSVLYHTCKKNCCQLNPSTESIDSFIVSVDSKYHYHLSLVMRKPVFGVSDQVRHKPGCTVTEDGERLEIWYLGSRGIVPSV